MKALQLAAFGRPADAVELVNLDAATPAAGQVLVSMEAAPINPSDLLLIRGRYGHRPTPPASLGTEGVGRIIEVGAEVDGSRTGERVLIMPNLQQGTWADQVVVDAGDAFAVDPTSDPLQVAMLGVNAVTAKLLLRSFAELSPGSWIAQTAANSAVGRHVIALAKLRGLRTLNIVRRADAAAELLQLGADAVVVNAAELDADVRAALGDARLALLLDAVGGESCARVIPWLHEGATVVSYGALSGSPIAASAPDLIFRDIRIRGFWQKRWVDTAPRAEVARTFARLAALVASGVLHTPVAATYPLERHSDALGHAADGARGGKVLFVW